MGYTHTPLGPLTKETDTTYGGTKPGKAPTPKPPKAPDPFKLIEAQGLENRTNEIGPSGSTTWSRDPVSRVWTQKREFSPELRRMYDRQVGLLEDPNMSDEGVERAMFDRQKQLLAPVFEEQDRALEQKLANQGLPIGSEAYAGERTRFDRTRNEALTGAANQAVLAGRQEGRAGRTAEFNQLAALLGGQQTSPGAPIDVMGPFGAQQQGMMTQYQGALANSQSQNQQRTAGATSLATMLAAMFMCWVAEELYGKEDKRTRTIRAYLMEHWNDKTMIGAFARVYKKHGIRWATWVRERKAVRFAARIAFDLLYARAKREVPWLA